MLGSTIYNRKSTSGLAVIELALILPAVVLIMLCGIEFARSFWFGQKVSYLTRELTRAEFRSISNLIEEDEGPFEEDEFDDELENAFVVFNDVNQIEEGIDFHVTVFTWDKVTETCALSGHAKSAGSSRTSTINEGSFVADEDLNELCEDHMFLIFGEVWGEYIPMLGYVSEVFGYEGGTMYVSAMY